ncbi:hypothetical protein Hanom_Chr09g00776831 [Helianthus anomalus]
MHFDFYFLSILAWESIVLSVREAASFLLFLLTSLPHVIFCGSKQDVVSTLAMLYSGKHNSRIHCVYWNSNTYSNNVVCDCAVSFLFGCALSLIALLMFVVYFSFLLLYTLWWKVATILPFGPIKHIYNKKKGRDEAKKVLKMVCDQIDKKKEHCRSYYTHAILEAACQNAYKVVAEILKRSPRAIQSRDKRGYDIVQLAIMHRSEKNLQPYL